MVLYRCDVICLYKYILFVKENPAKEAEVLQTAENTSVTRQHTVGGQAGQKVIPETVTSAIFKALI